MATNPKDLIEAHEAMALVLDAKFPNLQEWRAFRAIDRALYAALSEKAHATEEPVVRRQRKRIKGAPTPYMTLAAAALEESGAPLPTNAIVDYIAARRPIGDDPKKARIVIQSSLSKDERFESVPWQGGRAWWHADRLVPKIEAASTKPAA